MIQPHVHNRQSLYLGIKIIRSKWTLQFYRNRDKAKMKKYKRGCFWDAMMNKNNRVEQLKALITRDIGLWISLGFID